MQRYFSSKKENNLFTLSSNDMYHIKKVMRMKPNDTIEVVYDESLYICTLDSDYNVVISDYINKDNTKTKHITLCIPLLSDQKFSFILQKATELGVDEIIPVMTNRSIAKINDVDKKLTRWNSICKEASEQSKRRDIPSISTIKKIDDLSISGLKIVCSTKENLKTIKNVLQNNTKCDKMVLMVGPEGGLEDVEEEKLVNLGFIPVTLGKNILRVETVPIYLLSIINYLELE